MAVNTSKIRLGAASQVLLNSSQDMGATKGGVMFKYTPTENLIECDQFLGPVAVFRTKEEMDVETTFYQTQMALVAYAAAYNSLGTLTTTPGSPNLDKLTLGGIVQVPLVPLDLTIPKNDGTTNVLAVHINKVHSYKETQLDFARDKETTYKSVFNAIMDTTQAAGAQFGYITEQYY